MYLPTYLYKNFQNDPNKDVTVFYCIKCVRQIFALNYLSNSDHYSIVQRGIVLPDAVIENDQLTFLKCTEYLKNLNDYINSHNESDDFSSPPTDCKYYSIDDFVKSKFNPNTTTSIFHINIHSIEKHIDELRTYLLLSDFQFDVLAISESKLQTNIQPKVDITIEGYHSPLNSHTMTTKGGVLLHIKENIIFKLRPDLEKAMTELLKLNTWNQIVLK